jgi:hypothetical protein
MFVNAAKAAARQWVLTEGSRLPGFAGAFFHGSTNWLAADAVLPATSDLDIMLVFDEPPPVKLGKFVYAGVILEVSYMAWAELGSAENILRTAHLAGSFKGDSVIADPTGRLTALQSIVAENYAKRAWVLARCANAQEKILRNLDGIRTDAPFHEQVMAWLFGTGVTTHVLLVAGLRNPTVRKRYLAVRELLMEYDRLAFYEPLLELLGCADMNHAQVQYHLDTLTAAFDVAKTVVKTPFFFAADIDDLARPVAIGGSQELIDGGDHREAIFWIVATYARCQIIFYTDATPAIQAQFTPGFHALLADLGIRSFADLMQRSAAVRAFLPRLWQEAEALVAANPEIVVVDTA